jgi:integrase
MASIVNDPGGRRRILFVAPDGARKASGWASATARAAESICRHVEALLAAKIGGQPVPRDTAAWLANIGAPLRDKLAAVGLVDPAPLTTTVADLLEQYLGRADVKKSSKTARRCWGKQLIELLGNRSVATITPRDAERVRDALVQTGLAGPTVGRRLRFARQLFRMAALSGLIQRNPFDCLSHNFREGNLPQRDYAEVKDVERLLEQSPPPWRVLIALGRYAALRCPSEALLLRWADVNLPSRRLTVTSPKTENQGKPWRVVPIVPRLAEVLREAWELAEPGAEYVVDLPQYRDSAENWINCNIRTQLARIARRAGVPAWKRPFRVLRSSCVTDWAREHPVHCVAAWAGHTVAVAGRHYLTVTDADFERATGGAKSGAPEAHFPAQQATAANGSESQKTTQVEGGNDTMPLLACRGDYLSLCTVTLSGFEPEFWP